MIKEAPKKKTEGNISQDWTLDGKMFVKRSRIAEAFRVYSLEDISKL